MDENHEDMILAQAIEAATVNGYYCPYSFDIGWLHRMDIIFDHKFAKALWGDEPLHRIKLTEPLMENWGYHLQQMVIADDPIAYLGQNI